MKIKFSSLNMKVVFLELMNGIEEIKIAKAGVGRPINDFSCFISMLKFASLIAPKNSYNKCC